MGELRKIAKENGIKSVTTLRKQQLVDMILEVTQRKEKEASSSEPETVEKNEAETAINNAQGCIESTEFKGNYAVMLLLLPLKTELQPLFAGIIDECNQYGNFLHENMIITNVKKLTDEEIMHLLHAKNKPE